MRKISQTENENMERSAEGFTEGREKRAFRLTGSLVAKVTAFLLMLISAAVCAAGAVACYVAAEENMYTSSYTRVLQRGLAGKAHGIAYVMYDLLNNGYKEEAQIYLRELNAEVAIMRYEAIMGYEKALVQDSSQFIWRSYGDAEAQEENGFYSYLYVDIHMPMPVFAEQEGVEDSERLDKTYVVRVFFDPGFEKDDEIREVVRLIEALYKARYAVILICAGGAILFVICGIFLLCAAGHRNGREGIVPGLLTGIPFDVLTSGLFVVLMALYYLMEDLFYRNSAYEVLLIVECAIALVLGMLYLGDFAVRVKLGKLWKNTLIFAMLRILWRGLRVLGRGLRALFRMILQIPLVLTTVIVYMAVCILELLTIACFARVSGDGMFLWGLEKLAVFVVVLYIALTCRKLFQASRELAEGHEDYRVDTKYMFGAFQEQGENLNSLGEGVSKAVSERMKSERLKTELITNVSHDLKTPLTSIINYAELISREAAENPTENPKISEYSEVLLRQSGRLKRLLENLVEASKAVTGNMEVNPEPCEAGVLLSQAVGEYQQRLEEKELELRVSQPEEPVRILADGRHLWRIFDNLLNNICKYAQENSRVYLTLEQKGSKVFIIFRNMSKYALDISPEELEERFVRGDKSRHMEGNGLGLSIAKSLTELQNGQMDIVVDGDLFKVTLTFDVMG